MAQLGKFEGNNPYFNIRGVTNENRGTSFIVYEDIYDANRAVDNLSGFNVAGR